MGNYPQSSGAEPPRTTSQKMNRFLLQTRIRIAKWLRGIRQSARTQVRLSSFMKHQSYRIIAKAASTRWVSIIIRQWTANPCPADSGGFSHLLPGAWPVQHLDVDGGVWWDRHGAR
jgi:hypothetical protein